MRSRIKSLTAVAMAACFVAFGGVSAASAVSTVYKNAEGNWVRTFTGTSSSTQCRAFQNTLAREGMRVITPCYFDGGMGGGSAATSIEYR